jgi:hypothetical protein
VGEEKRKDELKEWKKKMIDYQVEYQTASAERRVELDKLIKQKKIYEKGEWLDFNSGYVTRVLEKLPCQGSRDPWRNTQNYKKDVLQLRYGRITDKELKFI